MRYETDHIDMERAQEELWQAEAGVLATQLAIPPQRDPNKARLSDRPDKVDPRSLRNKNRVPMFGDKDTIDTHIPGVGSSPTAELEEEKDKEEEKKDSKEKKDSIVIPKMEVRHPYFIHA